MASIASASPSGQGFLRANSTEDTDSWQYVDTNSPPAGYFASPSSSLNGWGIMGYPNHLGASPTAMSPLPPTTSQPSQQSTVNTTTGDAENQLLPLLVSQPFLISHELWFPDLIGGTMNTAPLEAGAQEGGAYDMSGFEGVNLQTRPADLNIPMQFQDSSNVAPWAPTDLQHGNDFMFSTPEDIDTRMSRTSSHGSFEAGSHHSSPRIPSTKSRPAKDTDPTKRVRGNSRVEKKKPAPRDNFVVVTPNTIHQQSGKPNPFECFEAARGAQRGRKGPLADKAAETALNIRRIGACFCCRSRKVKCDEERPCKNCKKISAQLPQIVCWQFSDFLPVLFPNFIRGHFKKDAIARFISDNVSQFYDVSPASTGPCLVELSSGLRFRSTLTLPASFFAPKRAGILQHWHMGIGAHQLDLHLRTAMAIGANPADSDQRDALRRRTREYVHSLVDEPLYAEQVTDSFRSTQLPRRILTIVQRFAQRSKSAMVRRALAIYATHYVLTRQLCLTPGTLARLQYLQQTQTQTQTQLQPSGFPISPSPGATNAYLASTSAYATARVLNRQVKAALDEHLVKETQGLLGAFGTALKPRSRTEWAPCLASFLVLCLLFEGIEAAADTFVVSEAEVALRATRRHQQQQQQQQQSTSATVDENKVAGGFAIGGRERALDVCREIDNLPFRQVAYRFHAVYQTHHVREPGVGAPTAGGSTGAGNAAGSGNGGAAFNPLLDPELDMDLEPAAAEMASSLRALLNDDDSWYELDFLAADPILSQAEAHPYPRDISLDYTGRLLARFLLSFTDEKYLFDGQY